MNVENDAERNRIIPIHFQPYPRASDVLILGALDLRLTVVAAAIGCFHSSTAKRIKVDLRLGSSESELSKLKPEGR
jgi:hypothetical protein